MAGLVPLSTPCSYIYLCILIRKRADETEGGVVSQDRSRAALNMGGGVRQSRMGERIPDIFVMNWNS